jgi:hypothetical protein
MSNDPKGHGNMEVPRQKGVSPKMVANSIEKDGTLVTQVFCSFVVHHAAWCEMTKETLAELISDQLGGEDVHAYHVDSFKIIEANEE